MRYGVVRKTALLVMLFASPVLAGPMPDGIQDEEEPGSEIEIDIGGGGATIHREDGKPILDLGPSDTPLQPLDDPDDPVDADPVDAELPGEGPQDLSGPFDEDPLPE